MFGSFLNEIASKLPEINRKDKEIYLKDKIDEKVFGDILIKVGLISIEIKRDCPLTFCPI